VNIACPAGTSYINTGLTDGIAYYYAVSAAFSGGPNAGGESANSREASATPQGGPPATAVSLMSIANVYGLFNNDSPVTHGGLDTYSFAYSKTLLGASIAWSGTTFTLGSAGVADAASGVAIPLPSGNFASLRLLATAIRGNQVNQTFTVTYTDGTTTSTSQSLSDWFTPQSYAGESKASTMAYRVAPTGATDNRIFYLYGYSLAINKAKTVRSVALPNNRDIVVLAATLTP
jgi:hypothetical protein